MIKHRGGVNIHYDFVLIILVGVAVSILPIQWVVSA